MTDHPLTDEAMHEIQGFCSGYTNRFDEDDMRAAYDKGAEDRLEQVIKCLEANKDLSVEIILRFIRPAMRPQPQQQED